MAGGSAAGHIFIWKPETGQVRADIRLWCCKDLLLSTAALLLCVGVHSIPEKAAMPEAGLKPAHSWSHQSGHGACAPLSATSNCAVLMPWAVCRW